MKTNYSLTLKNITFYLLGLLGFVITSCSSYQNSSYYDNDGVYGSDNYNTQNKNTFSEQNIEKSNKYAQQFRNMQDEYIYFTDVEEYNTKPTDSIVTVYKNDPNNNYAGWGNNATDITINYYNPSWGWNNWYSPYWGNYGYHNHISYNRGRRGGNGYYNYGGIRNSNRLVSPRPRFETRNNSPRFQNTTPRSENRVPRENRNTPRSNSRRNQNIETPRNSTPRDNNSSQRSNNYSSPRSSSSGSFGGGSFGGGGRSGGGRGGRG